IRCCHCRAQEDERREHEPVHDADPAPLRHSRVHDRFLEHRRPAASGLLGAPGNGLTRTNRGRHIHDGLDEHRDRDGGQPERHHNGGDLHPYPFNRPKVQSGRIVTRLTRRDRLLTLRHTKPSLDGWQYMPMTSEGLVIADDGVARPAWAASDPLLREYYDTEWGMPVRDERGVFERVS